MTGHQPGDRINNYLLEEQVGVGSFGQVWRAKHHMFDELVAIKLPVNAEYVQNLRREGVVIHGLRHANIVRAIDLDPYGDPPYLIMEYVPGASLRAFIDAFSKGLPVQAASAIMRGVLAALDAAHRAGVVHRDIKPANILLTKGVDAVHEVTEQCVKVTDFGLGQVGGVTAQSVMQSGNLPAEEARRLAGTLAYMAPEQRDRGDADALSDLYSCGIVWFEMLTGERPQGAEFPSTLRPDLSPLHDEVFRRCYVRRDRRFASASQMLAALRQPCGPAVPMPSRTDAGRCPSCHSGVMRNDQFCTQCGYQLVDHVPRCGACSAFVHLTDRFCIFCGHDLQVKST